MHFHKVMDSCEDFDKIACHIDVLNCDSFLENRVFSFVLPYVVFNRDSTPSHFTVESFPFVTFTSNSFTKGYYQKVQISLKGI